MVSLSGTRQQNMPTGATVAYRSKPARTGVRRWMLSLAVGVAFIILAVTSPVKLFGGQTPAIMGVLLVICGVILFVVDRKNRHR